MTAYNGQLSHAPRPLIDGSLRVVEGEQQGNMNKETTT